MQPLTFACPKLTNLCLSDCLPWAYGTLLLHTHTQTLTHSHRVGSHAGIWDSWAHSHLLSGTGNRRGKFQFWGQKEIKNSHAQISTLHIFEKPHYYKKSQCKNIHALSFVHTIPVSLPSLTDIYLSWSSRSVFHAHPVCILFPAMVHVVCSMWHQDSIALKALRTLM